MIKNRYKITIKALNQERIFNSLAKKVEIFDLQKDNDLTHFCIERKSKKTAKKILKQNNVKILAFQGMGAVQKMLNILKSYGIVVGLALLCCFYPLQYNLILKVVVIGEKTPLISQIECSIEEKLESRLKWNLDAKKLEKTIMQEFEEVSSVSVAIVGQSLIISINQAQLPNEMKDEFLPIVSEYDGRVESITLVQGTMAVEKGDIVQKGQVLVYPFIIDSQGQRRACQPKADIFASVWFEEKTVCYDRQIVTKRTGRKQQRREIFLNDVLIYKSKNVDNFASFEEESSWQDLTTKNLLPLKIKRTWVYETIEEEVLTDFSQIKDQVIQNARQKVLIFLKKNEIIKEENYTIKEEGGWHEISYILTVERNIGG